MGNWPRSEELYRRARNSLAAGVSSNVRLLAKPLPLFFERADGAMIYDADGNGYIDYVLGQGPLLLGHSHPIVLAAVEQAMGRGQLFAGQHELEITVAEELVKLIPCAELCRFSLSGSEVVQAAIRLARAATGRTKFLRFEGHYHGWFDNVLISVAPPLEKLGPRQCPNVAPSSQGQAHSTLSECAVLPWNDLTLVEELFSKEGSDIAAIITEPMMCNNGAIKPAPGFLQGLRKLCDEYGALLIMDEVITGFRLGLKGAQGRFGVTPDLATFGKAMAGGFPNAALVGKAVYMRLFEEGVNHSGTFNSNVISMAATAAALEQLQSDEAAIYGHLESIGTSLMAGIREIAQRTGVPLLVTGLPTAFHLSFTDVEKIEDYRGLISNCDQKRYERFAVGMLERGVRLLERGIWYVSTTHTDTHVEKTLETVEEVLREA